MLVVSLFLPQWGTKRKFMADPAAWWTDFWLRAHDTDEWAHAVPSAGHLAIARIMQFVSSPCSSFSCLVRCHRLPLQTISERKTGHTEHRPAASACGHGPPPRRRGPRRAWRVPLHQLVCTGPPVTPPSLPLHSQTTNTSPVETTAHAGTQRQISWRTWSCDATVPGAWCRRGARRAEAL